MAAASGGGSSGEDGIDDKDAKHLLDSIGKKVYDQVKREADDKNYTSELHGDLSLASIWKESASTTDPCSSDYTKHFDANSNRYPCKKDGTGNDDLKRFSKERVDEYDNKKMKCSNGKNEGACASFRRLHLCNKNMEKMGRTSTAKHDLLAEVCMAAKYEGESLKTYREQYDEQYPSSVSTFTMCTMLARSFADIGDIVRGKDLYLGNKKKKQKGKETETERDQLESKLKEIFKEIHDEVTRGKQNVELKTRYQNDTDNYFQLREDWWTANRHTVWEAITCGTHDGDTYFRATCSDRQGEAQAKNKCRCTKSSGGKAIKEGDNVSIVPTYFDYVPQFLRWFEEWAEDFCRKKNKKIKDVKRNCRGDNGTDRYCSRNGYDCTKTKRAIGKYRMGNQCTKCLYGCNPYVEWIDNQRKQFDKQVKKYKTEISDGGGRTKRGAGKSNYDGYESKFYKIFKVHYSDVNKFLEKLSKENVCTKIITQEEGIINFEKVNTGGTAGSASVPGGGTSGASGTNDINNGTFYRSKYCQPCPHCGVKRNGSGWEEKSDSEQCKNINLYKPNKNATATPIRILKSGEGHEDIKQKIDEFCKTQNGNSGNASGAGGKNSNNQELYEDWNCYKGKDVEKVKDGKDDDDDVDPNYVENAGGLCILQKNHEGVQKQKTYNDFFNFWVAHMLKDSIHWRTKKIKGCLSNGAKIRCKNNNKCKTDCGCFEKWVDQKKEQEWTKIKEHFKTQKISTTVRIGNTVVSFLLDNDDLLKQVLDKEVLLESIKEGYGNAKELEGIKNMLKEEEDKNEEEAGAGADSKKKNTIDKLLKHEEDEANKCKKIQEECEKTQKQKESRGRSADTVPQSPPPGSATTASTDHAEVEEDLEDEEDEEEEEEEEEKEEEEKDGKGTEEPEEEEDEPPPEEDTGSSTEEGSPPEVEGKTACKIVDELFEDDKSLKEACSLKYGPGGKERYSQWKCIPSGDKTGTISEGSGVGDRGALQRNKRDTDLSVTPTSDKGSICVPPRRRKLYVGKLEQWAESKQVGNTQGGSDSSQGTTEGSKSPQAVGGQATLSAASTETPESSLLRDGLREAFVESAAVETFFLWHKYKVDKKKEEEEKEERERENGGFGHSGEDDDPKPEDELKSGTIPNDFLRLMFYTLGDYRDILFSGGITGDSSSDKDSSSSNHEKNLVVLLSENKQDMEKIQKKIDEMIKQGENKESAIGGPKSLSVTHTQPSDKLTQWWDKIAEPIWNAMVCALTYKESDEKPTDDTNKIEQNSGLKEAFFGKDNNPDNKGTYNDRYQYSSVTLKDENSGTGALPTDSSPSGVDSTLNNPKLSDFVLRPTYFRYLEEWGQNFCKKRTEMLGKIKGECKVDNADYKCSCYGEECKIEDISNIGVFADLKCPGCGRECRKYKKWIGRKKIEFEEQKSAYDGQKTKCQSKSEGGDNGFCGTVQRCSKAAEFLQKLGPCSKNDIPEYKIDFSNTDQTFAHAKYCKPCSEFKIDCTKAKCTGAGTNDMCKGKNITITADNFQEKMAQSTQKLDMLVSDNSKSGNGFKDVLNECENANIFKGIRKEQWECGNFCGLDVCGLKRDNGKNYDQIILIRAFIERWLEYFLEDYNKIKHKISHRMNNGEQSPCIKGCKDKCSCVEKWVEQKKEEWKKIKEHYQKQYGGNDSGESYPVKTILEKFEHRPEFNKAIKPCPNLNKFESFCGLNGAEKSKTKDDKDNDLLLCMLKKLEKKATSCPGKHSGSEQCTTPPSNLEDDEEPYEDLLLDETEENTEEAKKKMMSKICDGVIKPEEETDDNCGKLDEEEKEEEKDKGDEEEEAPRDSAGSSTDQESKKPPEEKSQESVKPAPASPPAPPSPLPPSDESILQTTIPFGVALALGSIAFLFLK
ncbi:hypothetical protein PFAG_05985, partial [Plasmodium falciparum Santa Lucia]